MMTISMIINDDGNGNDDDYDVDGDDVSHQALAGGKPSPRCRMVDWQGSPSLERQ